MPKNDKSDSKPDMDGRPYVLMLMSYHGKQVIFNKVSEWLGCEHNLRCIRADEVTLAGEDLLNAVHRLIERAEFVIAEISRSKDGKSHTRENIMYELGYAYAHGKEVLLMAEENTKMPANLGGKIVLFYRTDEDSDVETLKKKFLWNARQKLRARSNSPWLRDMLEAPLPEPVYVISGDKHPEAKPGKEGQLFERRTFGMNLGVRGLLTAFGSMWGESFRVELLFSRFSDFKHVSTIPASLYLLGSHKVNPGMKGLLSQLQTAQDGRRLMPYWSFGTPAGAKEEGNWKTELIREENGVATALHSKTARNEEFNEDDLHTLDYGLIVRGPWQQDRIIMILAGAHALGTSAACVAATRSDHIRTIGQRLSERDIDLADKRALFWVLVSGRADDCFHLDESSVEVREAGTFKALDEAALPSGK